MVSSIRLAATWRWGGGAGQVGRPQRLRGRLHSIAIPGSFPSFLIGSPPSFLCLRSRARAREVSSGVSAWVHGWRLQCLLLTAADLDETRWSPRHWTRSTTAVQGDQRRWLRHARNPGPRRPHQSLAFTSLKRIFFNRAGRLRPRPRSTLLGQSWSIGRANNPTTMDQTSECGGLGGPALDVPDNR